MKEIGIYVHIPFCKRKCNYCDFISFECKNVENYIKSICLEIKNSKINLKLNKEDVLVKTIYIGGGTPSIIDEKYIVDILNAIKNNYNISKNAEVTIEANPGTINENKLKLYKQNGINRLSIGLQSTNDKLLEMLGRIHTYSEFEITYNLARKIGFNNINVDYMIGLPNQKIEDIEDVLKNVEKLKPNHVSIYSLILEDGTKITNLVNLNVLKMPSDELERNMYWKIKKGLESLNYRHYEISNFAKEGKYSRHNYDCWSQKEYLGFGLAAHSYLNNIRFSNIINLNDYINNCLNNKFEDNFVLEEKQNKFSKMQEYMMLGLRKIDGVNINEFNLKFNENLLNLFSNEIQKLTNEKLIEIVNGNIRLTNKGLDLANLVWEEFV